jgi:hypothetical protein
MNCNNRGVLIVVTLVLSACQTSPSLRVPTTLALTGIYGPVVDNEVIGGRADDQQDRVWLLVGGTDLVSLDLRSHRRQRMPLKLAGGDHCWGLARLRDGSLWTLKGRHAVIHLQADGGVERELPLKEAHFGLFAVEDRLIYQQANFTPPAPALRAGVPGDVRPEPWGAITTRTFGTLARASAAALNMVSCGTTRRAERPCWFPDEAAISLIDPQGLTRRLALPGLTVVSPETLLTAENPPRPVRDVFVDADGIIWVLSSGTAPTGASEQPGGWIVARYGPRGDLLALVHLSEPARLILRAERGRLTVLTGAGWVSEVAAW